MEKFKTPAKYDSSSDSSDSEEKPAKKKRLHQDIKPTPTSISPSRVFDTWKLPRLIVGGKTSPLIGRKFPRELGRTVNIATLRCWWRGLRRPGGTWKITVLLSTTDLKPWLSSPPRKCALRPQSSTSYRLTKRKSTWERQLI